MLALKSSCPEPWNSAASSPANAATMQAPSDAARDPVSDPETAPRNALRRGEHDADDQSGLDDFAEDDEERGEHVYCAITTPCAVSEWIFAHERIAARRRAGAGAHRPCCARPRPSRP